jgi:alpha-beta hydrolase superfamily lysophospholipase
MFYERGYNVYIPLHPRHGYADRTGRALIGYRLEEALEHATGAFEVASALGERLTVMGLSAGANLTAWLAYMHPGIDLAVVMAPSLGIPAIPPGATRMAISLAMALPDIHSWWDPRTKINNPVSPQFAYAGFMTHTVLQTMRLGQQVKQLARNGSPLARRILLISNASDIAVSNAEISQLHKLWEGYPGFQAYVIPKEAQVEHDFITLDINAERNKKIYPKLLDLIDSD